MSPRIGHVITSGQHETCVHTNNTKWTQWVTYTYIHTQRKRGRENTERDTQTRNNNKEEIMDWIGSWTEGDMGG